MNKDWFVFKGTQHKGPFSVEEVAEFYRSKEITEKTLIWKEGNEKWEPLSKISAFHFLFKAAEKEEIELPPLPSFPPIPAKTKGPTLPKLPAQLEVQDDDELPPPIPLDAIIDPRGQVRQRIKNEEKSSRYSKYSLIVGSILFAGILGWYALTQKQADIQLRIKGLMPVYLEKLELTAIKNSPKFEAAMALSLDGQTLWGSTNKGGDVSAVIRLNSIPHKVLGTEDVALSVKGRFTNHLAKFNKMTLTEGSKFLPGEYKFHVEAKEIHFLNRHFSRLNSIAFFRGLNKIYSYDGEALIYSGTPREFAKRLAEFSAAILNEKLRPFQDKLERMQTYDSILNATSQNFLMELDKAKTGKAIHSFEAKFIKEISPLLQSLVVKSMELSEKEEKNRLIVSPYGQQVLLGKQIGELASDMITRTEKIKKLTDKEKSALRAELDTRSRNIKLQIDLNTRKIEEQIQKISN
ncbi:MAG: DUF4339 domain-containing protein [Bacteriovorax sp.]|jgi:hypothetical protein